MKINDLVCSQVKRTKLSHFRQIVSGQIAMNVAPKPLHRRLIIYKTYIAKEAYSICELRDPPNPTAS